MDHYDGSIRFADDCLRDFIAFLDRQNAFDNTIFVLLSDHGEEFNEHGQIGHEKTLYIESLKVPLIIVAPHLTTQVLKDTVGLRDVMPTLLEMIGIEPPPVQGRSLLPLMMLKKENRQN